MILSLLRHHRKRDWKKVYVDKVDHIKEEALLHADKYAHVNDGDNPSVVGNAAGFILSIMNQRIDRDGGMSEPLVHSRLTEGTTIGDLLPPSDPAQWVSSWGTQAMCLLCGLPGISDCRVCENCDNIAHKQCISYELLYRTTRPDMDSVQDQFVCSDCVLSKQLSVDHFNKVKAQLLRDKMRLRSAKRIAKFMIVLCGSRFLERRTRAVLRLQSAVRGFLAYSKYRSYLKAKMKLLILEITKLPAAAVEISGVVVVLTVFDTFKHVQTMRIEKTAEEALKEGFFIPGINAKMTVVFNLARQIDLGRDSLDNVGRKHYQLYAQAELSLKDIADFTRQKSISFNFSEKIKWPPSPTEATVGMACKYVLVLGPPTVPIGEASSAAIGSPSGEMPMSPAAGNSYSGCMSPGGSRLLLLGPDRRCVVRYVYQNPVLTIVGKIQGPPLDILKRPPEMGIKKNAKPGAGGSNSGSSSGGNSRNSRYWLCLYQLRLLLFQFYGDIYPRFVSDVSCATAVLVRDKKGRPTSYVSIVHSDSRLWTIDFGSVGDALSFEFALNESKKAHSETGSMYHQKTASVSFMLDLQFGFSVQTTY